MLGLRTVNKDRKSNGGLFQWPSLGGTAIAPDWDGGLIKYGGGLYFLPWGEGNYSLLSKSDTAIWQVVDDHDALDTVLFDRTAKARELTVVFEGDRKGATDYLITHGGQGRVIAGLIVVVGDKELARVGESGKAEAGNFGEAEAGDYGNAKSGYNGRAKAGNYGKAETGDYGISSAGNYGKSETGLGGTAIAGNYSRAESGIDGKSITGKMGIAITGLDGKAKAGINGMLIISHWDGIRWRTMVAYVGEDGILPDVFYKLDNNGKFVLADT